MRRKILLALFLLLLFVSCSQFKELRRQHSRANVSLPKAVQVAENTPKELIFSRPDDIIFVREDGEQVPINVSGEWDSLYQENVTSIKTEEVLIVASGRRNVPERNGKIAVEFVVSVPQELQHKNRLLYIQPILMRNGTSDSLPDLRFTGKEVRNMQEKEYADYQRYLGKIIPDTVDFYTTYVKHQAYESYLADLKDEKRQLQQRWALYDAQKGLADPLFTRFHYFNRQSVRKDSLLAIAFQHRSERRLSERSHYYEKKQADTIVYTNRHLMNRLSQFNQKTDQIDSLRKQRDRNWNIQRNNRYTQWNDQWKKDSIRLSDRFFAKSNEKTKEIKEAKADLKKGEAAYSKRFSYFNERSSGFMRDTVLWSSIPKVVEAPDTVAFYRKMDRLSARYASQIPSQRAAKDRTRNPLLPMYGYHRQLPDSFTIVRSKVKADWRQSLEAEGTQSFTKQYQATRNWIPMYRTQREIAGDGYQFKRYSAKQRPIEQQINRIDSMDSVEVMKRFYDSRKIALNEKRKKGKENYFKRTVRFPYGTHSRLDSITVGNSRINYHYREEVDADENSAHIKLFLAGNVEDAQGRRYVLPTSDTLTYLVSSMTYFVQKRVRYLQKTIYRDAEVNFSANLDFPVGKSTFQTELTNNRKELEKIKMQTIAMMTAPEYVIDSLMLIANSSPEGAWQMNERLAKERAMTIRGVLQKEFAQISDSLGISSSIALDESGNATMLQSKEADNFAQVFNRIKIGWVGEDWKMLETMIANDSVIVHKEKILEILRKEREPDRRESLIRSAYGNDYAYIREKFYPTLRSVAFQFSLHRRGMVEEKVLTNVPDTIYAYGVELLEKRSYKKALEILRPYDDINTAVAYMSLGHNEAAFRILEREPESAHARYMKAILDSRLGREKDALIDFLRACELQPRLKFRGNLDPELSLLIKKYGLFSEDF